MNATLPHIALLLNKRDTIRDVPVIYLVEPTEENIDFIVKDAEELLYDYIFFAFTKPISNSTMENLASRLVKCNAAERVMKVYENYLSFFCHTPQLFTICSQPTYASLAVNRGVESVLDFEIKNIVNGLFSMFECTNYYPIIRFRKGDISETIAYELNSLFQEKSERDEKINGYRQQPRQRKRWMLLLFNRDIDWSIMLKHSWTYLPLIHDLIGIDTNQIKVKEEGKEKSYDLDFINDPILQEYAIKEIPELGENIDKKLQEWKLKYDQMNNRAQTQEVSEIFSNLNSVLDSLPKIKQEREKIEAHSNICTSIFDLVKQRDIDTFEGIEDELITKKHISGKTKKEMDELMYTLCNSKKAGLDRLRLLWIYILATNPKKSEVRDSIQKLSELFPETNYDLALKIWGKLNPSKDGEDDQDENQSSFSRLWPSMLKVNVNSLIGNQASDSVIAEIVQQFYDWQGDHKEFDSDSYIDTLTSRELEFNRAQQLIFDSSSRLGLNSNNTCNVVVYVAGGGSYYEYQKIIELQDKIGKQVIYGCDYLYSPEAFVDELKNIYKE